ncbi:MAG: sugar phosphate isomerase/epimerase [Caldilineaceae bacterium]|nr:sugar phosphate isomerase/epimerase [Caldilineaceae bacterium]
MRQARFTLSAFGDEIAPELTTQLTVLRDLQIGYLELRGVWGKNVLTLSDAEARRVQQECADFGIRVSAIGSPIGKSPLRDPIAQEVANLERLIAIGTLVGTQRVRIFSFYPPDQQRNDHYDQHVDEVVARLERLAAVAQAAGIQLLLENEKHIVGDTIARCHTLLTRVNSPALVFAWDPANFVQVGEEQITERAWPQLGPYTGYVHIKDSLRSDGTVRPAGQGDGQVGLLLGKLREAGYQGFLALEPHLVVAGHSSGFSGPAGMQIATEALRNLMQAQGCVEEH